MVSANADRKRKQASPDTPGAEPIQKSLKFVKIENEDNTKQPPSENKAKEEPSVSFASTQLILQFSFHTGDMFNAPPETLLIHACNTQGSWGAGIAAAFRFQYPQAFEVYRDHCLKTYNPTRSPVPVGTCLLIAPCETDPKHRKHWIGCLFTSAKYGKGKDKPDAIVENTGPAMSNLIKEVRKQENQEKMVGKWRMCKINSGKFGVPWERTRDVLRTLTGGSEPQEVQVWSME